MPGPRPSGDAADSALPHFLRGGGEAGALIRSIDWGNSLLGAPHTWPATLKTTLGIILNSRHPMFLWWGPELTQFYNDAYTPSFGKGKHPAAMGQRGEECWPEIWPIIFPQIRAVMERGIPSWNENQLVPIFRDGAIQDVYWTYGYSAVVGDDGAVLGTLVVCQETTAMVLEKQALEAAHRQADVARQRLLNLFESAPIFVSLLSGPDHRFELVNPMYQKLIGPRRDVIGKPVAEGLPEVVEQGFIALLDRVFQSASPHVGLETKVNLARADGGGLEQRFLNFVYQPRLDTNGAVRGIDVFGFDVTEGVLARIEAQRARDVSRALSEFIPQQVWTAASTGAIETVNKRVLEYFGSTEQALVGSSWERHVHVDDRASFVEHWTAALESTTALELECRLVRPDGTSRWHLVRALALRTDDGPVTQWFGTNTDIDDTKRVREEQRLRLDFERHILGIVSHDLRTPLHVISMGTEFLAEDAANSPASAQVILRIQASARRGLRMLEDLLDFTQARLGGGLSIRPQSVDLHVIADAVHQELSVLHPGRVIEVRHEGSGVGAWDRDRVTQLLVNLMSNAIQYGAATEPIALETGGDDSNVWLTVRNAGTPIPEAAQRTLFEPMQRATRKNTSRSVGLGLFIVAEIAKRHGGSVEVKSSAESGTIFTVRLPRYASA